jgi:hypothetical protein
MAADTSLIVEGLDVVAPNGDSLGTIKEVRTHDFLLNRSMRRDLYVPFSAVREVGGRTVVLGITASELGNQGWEAAPLFGGPNESDSTAPAEELVVGIGDPEQRNGWSPSSDSYSLDALDTTEGRQAVEGTDDGERPRPANVNPETARRTAPLTDADRVRDLLG